MAASFRVSVSLALILLWSVGGQGCAEASQQFLVTFHPHLDAFWLNTDKELKDINFVPASFLYEMNQRNSKTILNSMLASLRQNTSRKYFITEVVFFKDWYEYLEVNLKKEVQKLMMNGQFQLVNGGWVENDEAVCYFDDILDQYTVGLSYLKSQFNYETKVGWATDSFGHSHSQVALLHLLGFELQGIERVDERYIHQHANKSLLEFYWSPVSDSNNLKYGGVVTYLRHFLHEVNNLRTATPQNIAADFSSIATTMKQLYHKPKLFRFLGNDFQEFIPEEFQKMESAMDLLNGQSRPGKCPVYKYGNPGDYLSLVKSEYKKDEMPVRQFDFMPNWDQDHYWTGYYTTNPDLKKICKDFSRLVNFFRKKYVQLASKPKKLDQLLNSSNQLLALIQHHDGITATSKNYIEDQMKQRMKSKTIDLVIKLSQLTNSTGKEHCQLYSNGNRCVMRSQESVVYFSIFHEGTYKRQKIELQLPEGKYYEVQNKDNWEIFCVTKLNKCFLVFEADLVPGENVLVLKQTDSQQTKDKQTLVNKVQASTFSCTNFKIWSKGNQIHYTFNSNQFFRISIVKAKAEITSARTSAWDKYGKMTNKDERRIPGIYVMANNGNLEEIDQGDYSQLCVGVGKHYTKVHAVGKWSTIEITIKNDQPHILQLQSSFQPPNYQLSDYFLRLESSVNPKDDEFYHDMNGYLVMKRKIDFRPDYKWAYKRIDKIAGNTYPLCSFAYAIDQRKKFVLFTDRAGGISLFDKAFILNIDRIASDDYKGVGEGYTDRVRNTFYHKIALVDKDSFIERQWQKSYDEPLMAFYSKEEKKGSTFGLRHTEANSYLKYTVFNLNENEYVVRLVNLQENKDLKVAHFSSNSWDLPQLNLKLKYQKIKESFAHGVPITPRQHWKDIPGEINTFDLGKTDTPNQLILRPLQIRSFRVTTTISHIGNKGPLKDIGKAGQVSLRKKVLEKAVRSEVHEANQATNKGKNRVAARLGSRLNFRKWCF